MTQTGQSDFSIAIDTENILGLDTKLKKVRVLFQILILILGERRYLYLSKILCARVKQTYSCGSSFFDGEDIAVNKTDSITFHVLYTFIRERWAIKESKYIMLVGNKGFKIKEGTE